MLGVSETLIHDTELPANVSIVGIAIDKINLPSYDLRSHQRLFLSPLTDDIDDVTVNFNGNTSVTYSAGNVIWKVTDKGESSIFFRSDAFTKHHVEVDNSFCGLTGIAYISKDYLQVIFLHVAQSNTGKMFKVDGDNGKPKLVLLNKNLTDAEGIAVRDNGSDDSWGVGVVYDETALDVKKFASSIAVRNDNRRVYVLYGNGDEAIMVGDICFGWFWICYLMFWRFQMHHLAKNMNKKTA
ncbi:hypothetical protein MKX01_006522 [Papaver californicum]|nr:hypothetical protein MKX01_006522 [Papaver californicum]